MFRVCRDLIRKPLTGVVLVSLGLIAGCASRSYYGGPRVYDSYHHDYHVWDNNEGTRYQQWEGEGHRTHVEFSVRKANDQKQYWDWRHNH